ncbi:MAG: hypothetical protein EPN21_09255 [Methylococcaceae bacterium]|nr:MAG: hypothetical protein EPN21_09255 [Methylococcaceae bacterium]
MKLATVDKGGVGDVGMSPYSLRRSVRRMMAEEGFSPHRITVEAGVNRAELTAWLEDRDKAPQPVMLEKLESWLAGDSERAPTVPLNSPPWVETPTAVKIMDALDYARYTPTIAVIYGSAGVGKTKALGHFAETRPNTWLVTASPCCHTTTSILGELLDRFDAYGSAQRADVLYREALRCVRNRTRVDSDINGLLIIDEAQHLKPPAYDTIRAFLDQADVGIAYAGNEEMYSRIGGKKKSSLPQISSRVGIRVKLSQPEPGDVDMIMEAHGISGRKEREYCQWVASLDGGLRLLDHVIRPAKLSAMSENTAVSVSMLKAAGKVLGIES